MATPGISKIGPTGATTMDSLNDQGRRMKHIDTRNTQGKGKATDIGATMTEK